MATLYIAEFAILGSDQQGIAQIAQVPPTVEQTVAIGGSTTPSAAFAADTQIVRIHADVVCSIAFGAAPTATATTMRLAAGQTEYFGVVGGVKVAVITNT